MTLRRMDVGTPASQARQNIQNGRAPRAGPGSAPASEAVARWHAVGPSIWSLCLRGHSIGQPAPCLRGRAISTTAGTHCDRCAEQRGVIVPRGTPPGGLAGLRCEAAHREDGRLCRKPRGSSGVPGTWLPPGSLWQPAGKLPLTWLTWPRSAGFRNMMFSDVFPNSADLGQVSQVSGSFPGGMWCLPAHLCGAGSPARVLITRPTISGGKPGARHA